MLFLYLKELWSKLPPKTQDIYDYQFHSPHSNYQTFPIINNIFIRIQDGIEYMLKKCDPSVYYTLKYLMVLNANNLFQQLMLENWSLLRINEMSVSLPIKVSKKWIRIIVWNRILRKKCVYINPKKIPFMDFSFHVSSIHCQ